MKDDGGDDKENSGQKLGGSDFDRDAEKEKGQKKDGSDFDRDGGDKSKGGKEYYDISDDDTMGHLSSKNNKN